MTSVDLLSKFDPLIASARAAVDRDDDRSPGMERVERRPSRSQRQAHILLGTILIWG